MESRQWLNPSQPQTLQIAVILLYIDAFFLVLRGGIFTSYGLLIIAGSAGAGFGIANERKWGYALGVAVACFGPVLRFALGGFDAVFGVGLINLMFEVALIALLLHPQSREYQRVWFK
jgi:hypothetical protein